MGEYSVYFFFFIVGVGFVLLELVFFIDLLIDVNILCNILSFWDLGCVWLNKWCSLVIIIFGWFLWMNDVFFSVVFKCV